MMRQGARTVALGIGLLALGSAWLHTANQAASPSPPPLAKGDKVPTFEAEGLDRKKQSVAYPKGSTTVLLFFMSSCPTCHQMIPAWNTAYERRGPGLRVYGMLLDQEPPDFFLAVPISFPVLRVPGRTAAERRTFTEKFRVQKVPVTMRIGADGTVEDVVVGLADRIRVGQLFGP